MHIKSCHQESVIGGYMKGFKHGCLLGMIIVLGIAGWIWYTPNVWQQYWKECMLLCIFGVITGSVYYERALLVIKPEYASAQKELLEQEAKKLLENMGEPSSLKRSKKRFKNIVTFCIAAAIGAIFTAFCFLI